MVQMDRFASKQLGRMGSFCQKLCDFYDDVGHDSAVVVCSGEKGKAAVSDAMLFVGAFAILHRGHTADAVVALFEAAAIARACDLSAAEECSPPLYDCWRALHRAKSLAWFVDPSSDSEPVLDVEEFAHYAATANGTVHLTVPGRLIFFPTPEDLPDGQDWEDSTLDSGRVVRRFGGPFYADLLRDLGASCVVCLGSGGSAAAAAFAARGLHAEDLGLAADGSSMLRGLDRLLELSRAAPGAVAVHSGDGLEWPEYLGTLVTAFLISRAGFDGGSGRAWVRMVGAWMLGGGAGRPAPLCA